MGSVTYTDDLITMPTREAKVIAQDLTQPQRADLCKGKKELLQRYEQEASRTRMRTRIWQTERDSLLTLVNSSRDHLYRVKENYITEYLIHFDKLKEQLTSEERESEELQLRIAAENLKLVHNLPLWTRDLPPSRQLIASSSIYQQAENQLRLLSLDQQRVANQTWILRAAIDSLRCDQIDLRINR